MNFPEWGQWGQKQRGKQLFEDEHGEKTCVDADAALSLKRCAAIILETVVDRFCTALKTA
jgi:hypothetical protein